MEDYTDAWVRDNVYSIMGVWGLYLAYGKLDRNGERATQLSFSSINLMRGMLRAMMRQKQKVEAFKSSLALHDALHAKYDTETGLTVVGDHEWGHLQIDATSLFLLMTAQMVASGLPIIQSNEEVDFIQNLVYYIERAYRIPDYGIWERGEKSNVGYVELNASSLGMAKAALEALDEFKIFQNRKIYVVPDNIAIATSTLEALLPRESSTKETDGALLSIIGFPAFAIKNQNLRHQVESKIRANLAGKYGYKRFLLDGHQTAIEDPHRHYYEPEELKQFENIECEWPLFLTYEYLNTLFTDRASEARHFREMIENCLIQKDQQKLIPELFFVKREDIEAERRTPGSQARYPNDNLPLTWAQSLLVLGDLLAGGHVTKRDLDPLERCRKPRSSEIPAIQVIIFANSLAVRETLQHHRITSQLLSDLDEQSVRNPDMLTQYYSVLGKNDKLGLSGRPARTMPTLTTSCLYEIDHQIFTCLSLTFQQHEFYLTYDVKFLVVRFRSALHYIQSHWQKEKAPTISILLNKQHLTNGEEGLITFLKTLSHGTMDDIPVRLTQFAEAQVSGHKVKLPSELAHVPPSIIIDERKESRILHVSGRQIPLTELEEIQLENETDETKLLQILLNSTNLFEHIEVMTNLYHHHGLSHKIFLHGQSYSLSALLEDAYQQAGKDQIWSILRQSSALLGKVDPQLHTSVNYILVNQKNIQIGKAYSEESLITKPVSLEHLLKIIKNYCHDDIRDQVLTQEVLVYLGLLTKSEPRLFQDLLTIRVSYLILLLTGLAARQQGLSQEDAFDWLMHQPPSYIQSSLREILAKYSSADHILKSLEALSHQSGNDPITWQAKTDAPKIKKPQGGWLVWRKSMGTINRENDGFYESIWRILEHAQGIIIGDKLDRRNRLTSSVILSDMTAGERAFALRVENLLNKIPAPEYRQVTVETLWMISSFTEQNPQLIIRDHIVIDVIIGHAVRLCYTDHHPEMLAHYQDHKPEAWSYFYTLSPRETTKFIAASFNYLLAYENETMDA